MKHGKVKREHGRIRGLDALCDEILAKCPGVSRIVPGRIKTRRGHGPAKLTVQYATEAGLKLIYSIGGTVQEVFVVCSDAQAAEAWLKTWITANRLGG